MMRPHGRMLTGQPGSGRFMRGGTRRGQQDDERVPISRGLVRRVARLFTPYKGQVTAVTVLIVVSSALGVANPLLIRAVFDDALFPPGGPRLDLLVGLVALMVLIPIIGGVLGIGQTYLTNKVGQQVMQDLRDRLYGHLQRLSLRFFTATRTGEIQSRLANDVGGVQSVVTGTAASVLANIVIVLSTVIAMLVISLPLTVLSLALLPVFALIARRVGAVRQRIADETQRSLASMSSITQETLSVSGVLLAKAFGRQQEEIRRYREENARQARLQVRQQMVGQTFFALVQVFFSITPALVYLAAGLVLARGDGGLAAAGLTAGGIVAFTTLQARLFFPVGQMLQIFVELQASLALFHRVFEYLDERPDITDAPDAVDLDPEQVRGEVRLRGVHFRYDAAGGPGADHHDDVDTENEAADVPGANGQVAEPPAVRSGQQEDVPVGSGQRTEVPGGNGRAAGSPVGSGQRTEVPAGNGLAAEGQPSRQWALRGVDLHVRPGQLAALVGPSGAGKTTISYLVPRLYDATDGTVELDGTDVRRLRLASIAGSVGMVTQESYLFHASVRANITYGRPDATHEQVEAAARAAHIHDRITELSDGYDTVVGERGYRLSGGEKQRLAIARVLLVDPRVLILDEATSALDTTSERLVQQALGPLMRGRTTIAIAHRLSTILAADVIFVLDRGRVVEQGTHAELVGRGGLYAQLYDQQFQGGLVEAQCQDGVVLADIRQR